MVSIEFFTVLASIHGAAGAAAVGLPHILSSISLAYSYHANAALAEALLVLCGEPTCQSMFLLSCIHGCVCVELHFALGDAARAASLLNESMRTIAFCGSWKVKACAKMLQAKLLLSASSSGDGNALPLLKAAFEDFARIQDRLHVKECAYLLSLVLNSRSDGSERERYARIFLDDGDVAADADAEDCDGLYHQISSLCFEQ